MWASPRSNRQREPRYPEDFDIVWSPRWDSPSLLSDQHVASSMSDICEETYEMVSTRLKGERVDRKKCYGRKYRKVA